MQEYLRFQKTVSEIAFVPSEILKRELELNGQKPSRVRKEQVRRIADGRSKKFRRGS